MMKIEVEKNWGREGGSEGEEETDQVIWRVKKGHNKEHLHIFIFTSTHFLWEIDAVRQTPMFPLN